MECSNILGFGSVSKSKISVGFQLFRFSGTQNIFIFLAVCPLYTPKNIEQDAEKSSRMQVTIEIELVSLQYGNLIEQSVELQSNSDNKTHTYTWKEEEINEVLAQNQTKPKLSTTFRNLGIKTTYVPYVSWKSKLTIRSEQNDDNVSTAEQSLKCKGQEFSTNKWNCTDKDSTIISSSSICDSNKDCPNGRDEDPKICQGENLEYVIPGVGIYVFLGIVAYIGMYLKYEQLSEYISTLRL